MVRFGVGDKTAGIIFFSGYFFNSFFFSGSEWRSYGARGNWKLGVELSKLKTDQEILE